MDTKALLQKFRSLPPHFRYPLLAAAAVVVLVAAHAVFDRPAPTPSQHVAASPVCHYKGQIVGCVCPPRSQCAKDTAAETRWKDLLAKESVGAAPPLPAAAAKPAPAATTVPTVASGSIVAAPVPVPVQPPTGVHAGLLHVVTEGRDSFGAWLTLSDHVIKSPTLTFAIPALPPGTSGARRVLVSGWVHVVQPVQTVTLREEGPAAVTLTIAGQKIATGFDNSGDPRSQQAVANLQTGWYEVKLTGAEAPSWAGSSHVEVQLGSTNLNPVIPVPYWTPAKATAKAPAASAKAAPAPAPAASVASPKAAQVGVKVKAVPVPVKAKAGTARVGHATKEKKS